jgi:hypothetical protein
MVKDFASSEFEETKLAFDLRVFYAAIIGRRLIEMDEHIKEKNYSAWFRDMCLLYPIICSRVDNDRKEIAEKFIEMKRKALKKINEFPNVYSGKSLDNKGVAELEIALIDFQHLIYRVLHISNQFGSEKDIAGIY